MVQIIVAMVEDMKTGRRRVTWLENSRDVIVV